MDEHSDSGSAKGKWGVRTLAGVSVAFLVAGFVMGIQFGDVSPFKAARAMSNPRDANWEPLYRAWELLDQYFIPATTTDSVSDEEKIWGAVQGLAASYGDPYTEFLPPREKEIFETEVSGNFGGVGIEIDIRDDMLTVVAPLKGTPAEKAGIKSGDIVLEVDGEDTRDLSLYEAVEKIRGPEGTDVVLTILRDDEPAFDVTLTRAQIVLPTVEYRKLDNGIFVIEVYSFNALAPDKFREAVRAFGQSNSDKLILDLRGNPGGYLEVAVDMASWFLPVGKLVAIQDFADSRDQEGFRSRGYDVFNDNLKLVVLVDGGSASASEILAGALKDHGTATLIGTKTFGKGSVQQVFEVTNETSLKITIARWLTPSGISISHEGLKPDIEVERTREDVEANRDPQLERAVQFLIHGQ